MSKSQQQQYQQNYKEQLEHQSQIQELEINDQFQKVKRSDLNRFLVCHLCDGYYRFAHTLIECGHSFCQICIFDHMKTQKGRMTQCPKCLAKLDPDIQKSIKKDPMKQALVDMIYPDFTIQETQMVNNVKKLFPSINLEWLLEEFNYDNMTFKPQKKQNKENSQDDSILLPKIVKQYLDMEFDQFVQSMYNQEQCDKLYEQMKNKYPEFYVVQANIQIPTEKTTETINQQQDGKISNKKVSQKQQQKQQEKQKNQIAQQENSKISNNSSKQDKKQEEVQEENDDELLDLSNYKGYQIEQQINEQKYQQKLKEDQEKAQKQNQENVQNDQQQSEQMDLEQKNDKNDVVDQKNNQNEMKLQEQLKIQQEDEKKQKQLQREKEDLELQELQKKQQELENLQRQKQKQEEEEEKQQQLKLKQQQEKKQKQEQEKLQKQKQEQEKQQKQKQEQEKLLKQKQDEQQEQENLMKQQQEEKEKLQKKEQEKEKVQKQDQEKEKNKDEKKQPNESIDNQKQNNKNEQKPENQSNEVISSVVLQLDPKKERDYKVAQLRNKLIMKNRVNKMANTLDIKRFILKNIMKFQQKVNFKDILTDNAKYDNIDLFFMGRILEENKILNELKDQFKTDLVFSYELKFHKE